MQATAPVTTTGSADSGLLLPSPLPSPTSQAVVTAETSSSFNLAQQGAAAMRWVARLSEFVQWRASYVSQGRPGEHEQTTVVQETVWSPTSRATAGAETQPLFRRTQVRRLQDMTTAAPQLYGAVPQRGGGSESSASYTRDQLEMEVRRQVEQAMEKQRGVSEENRALKAELERARREAAERREAVAASVAGDPLVRRGEGAGLGGHDQGRVESNPAGLSGHVREQGGHVFSVRAHDQVPEGNPGGPGDRSVERSGGELLDARVGVMGTSSGLLGQVQAQSNEERNVRGTVPGGNLMDFEGKVARKELTVAWDGTRSFGT